MPNIGQLDAGTIQPLRTVDITLPTHQETLLGTPEALATTEPGTSQISYTIQASDLPTLPTGVTCKYSAILVVAGKNADAAGQTVSYRVLKNSSSVATATSTSITANQYWTYTHYRFYDVVAGDVLECRLWASDVDVNWDYKALFIYPTRVSFAKTNSILANVKYTVAAWPTLASGTPSVNTTGPFNPYNSDYALANVTAITEYKAQVLGVTNLSGRVSYADTNILSILATHATDRPRYYRNYVPTQITFNPTPITV